MSAELFRCTIQESGGTNEHCLASSRFGVVLSGIWVYHLYTSSISFEDMEKTKVKSVLVVGGDRLVEKMFVKEGYYVCDDPFQYDYKRLGDIGLVCFTGGEDVSPHLYGEENLGKSHCNPRRDEIEIEVYYQFVDKVPFVGICRGGQLLNVLNGGKMIQHIEGHSMGYHEIFGFKEQDWDVRTVHGDHHQGILPNDGVPHAVLWAMDTPEIAEVVFYPKTRSFCFQPHPEWGHEGTRKLFFELLERYLKCS